MKKIVPLMHYYDTKDQFKRYVYSRSEEAFAAGDAARDSIKDIEELKKRRVHMRTKFMESIGRLPSEDTPLNPEITGCIECQDFRIEKVIFESRPNVFITANLYIPNGIVSPQGAVLFLCGHHEKAKHEEEYQIVCRYFVRSGLVVLAQDPIGQGERLSYYESSTKTAAVQCCTIEHDYAGSQCWPLGDGLARYFVHDAMRGIDYLITRPEVDPARIGVTGNSGGGLQTAMLMVCDTRIAAAAPCTYLMNRQVYLHAGGAQDSEQNWPGMSALGFDHEDILMSMAPRPVLVLAAKYDFFPIEGTRRSVKRTKRFWEMFGVGDCLEMYEEDIDHHYTRNMARKAAQFFSRHLLNDKDMLYKEAFLSDEEIEPIAPSLLWCTRSGQVRGEIGQALFVYDENRMRLEGLEQMRENVIVQERKQKAIEWLRQRVFLDRKHCELNPRFYSTAQISGLTVQACLWWSQHEIFNNALIFRNIEYAGKDIPVTIAVWDNGTDGVEAHVEWIRSTCCSGRAAIVLDVSGVGVLTPNSVNGFPPLDLYGAVFKFGCDLLWLDDNLAAIRTYDVIRSLDFIRQWPELRDDDIHVYAHGRYGLYALLAAFLDMRIKNIKVVDGMGSYTSWVGERYYNNHDIMSVILPGVLKYFDLPDLEKWIEEDRQQINLVENL